MKTESNLFEIMSSAVDIEDIKSSGFYTKPKKYMHSAKCNNFVATFKLLKVSLRDFFQRAIALLGPDERIMTTYFYIGAQNQLNE